MKSVQAMMHAQPGRILVSNLVCLYYISVGSVP